jgi:hypothetical protein
VIMHKIRKVYQRRIVARRKNDTHKMRRHYVTMNKRWGYTPFIVKIDEKAGKKTWAYTKTVGWIPFGQHRHEVTA